METKTKLIELLELCIEKQLNFDYSPKHGLITILEFNNNSAVIFNEDTWSLDSEDKEYALEKLNELIEKVKNYKNNNYERTY